MNNIIMCKLHALFLATLCLAASPLLAADAATPDAKPPKLEKLEEGEPPAITIRKPDAERKVTEKRDQGKVTEIKVQAGRSTYYLKPNEPAGSAVPGDAEASANRAAQWQVLEFGNPKELKEAEPPQTLEPAGGEPPPGANPPPAAPKP